MSRSNYSSWSNQGFEKSYKRSRQENGNVDIVTKQFILDCPIERIVN